MVFWWTCPNRLAKIRFWWLVVHLSKELQWFSSPQDAECLSHDIKIRVWWIMVDITKEFHCFFVRPPFKLYFRLRPATKPIKTAAGAPRPKGAPRGSKSTTFAWGKFQVSNPQKIVANPIGEPSVSPFQKTIYLWLQAAAWEVSWRLVCRELQVDTVSKI